MKSRRRVNSTVRRNRILGIPMIQIAIAMILSLVVSAANVDCIGRAFADMPWQNRADSLSVAVPGLPRYSRKEMRVHRFLWTKWRQRRAATAELTFFGIDAGNVYTVNLKRDSGGRLVIEEYMRHYQAVGPGSTADTLVASGVALQRFRLRGGAFAVRIVTGDGRTVPLFE